MRRSEDVSSPSSFLSATLKPACLTPRWASSYLDISNEECVPSWQGEKEKVVTDSFRESLEKMFWAGWTVGFFCGVALVLFLQWVWS